MPAGRKPLGIEELVKRLPGSPGAQERLRVILANIAGQISVREACVALGIEESWFFELKHRSLERWLDCAGAGARRAAFPGAAMARAATDRGAGRADSSPRAGAQRGAAAPDLARAGRSGPAAGGGSAAKKVSR